MYTRPIFNNGNIAALATDASGNLYVAARSAGVYRISPSRVPERIAWCQDSACPNHIDAIGVGVDGRGRIYIDAFQVYELLNDGTLRLITQNGGFGPANRQDGDPVSEFGYLGQAMACDDDGNLYFAGFDFRVFGSYDIRDILSGRVRKVVAVPPAVTISSALVSFQLMPMVRSPIRRQCWCKPRSSVSRSTWSVPRMPSGWQSTCQPPAAHDWLS